MKKKNWKTWTDETRFQMAGDADAGVYFVIFVTTNGRVGYRHVGGDNYRVRIEPASKAAADRLALAFTRSDRYQQLGDDCHRCFSKEARSNAELRMILAKVVGVLLSGIKHAGCAHFN